MLTTNQNLLKTSSLSAIMIPHKELSSVIHTTHHSLTSKTRWVKFFILGKFIPYVCFHLVKLCKFKMKVLVLLPDVSSIQIISREDLCYMSRNIFRRCKGCLKAEVSTLILLYEIRYIKVQGKNKLWIPARCKFPMQ